MHPLRLARLPLYGLALVILTSSLVACSQSRWREVAPEPPVTVTGDPIAEGQKLPTPPALDRNKDGFVIPDRLRGRDNPDQNPDDSQVILDRNDRVVIVDSTPRGSECLIQIRTVQTNDPNARDRTVWVPCDRISPTPVQPTREQRAADRYFMIQNIATEKVRIYERCTSGPGCAHRLVMETDMVAGRDDSPTILGSFRVTSWFKFYEDHQGNYPSWYNPSYPALPPPGSDLLAWTSRSLLPNGRGLGRGKFGWYTAHVGPDARAQWTHGTIGWGADGSKFITRISNAEAAELDSDPRSAGCTRIENQAIAFAREILPAGSKIIKVYAKEAYRNPARPSYQGLTPVKYDWILTKEGVDVDGPLSSRASVLARGVPESEYLEQGSYVLDQMPDAVPFRDGRGEQFGNLYGLPESSLRGYYLVDEGRFVGYRHPRELPIGGHRERRLPPLMLSNDSNLSLPTADGKIETLRGSTESPRHNGRPVVINERPSQGAQQPAPAPAEPAVQPSSRASAQPPTAVVFDNGAPDSETRQIHVR